MNSPDRQLTLAGGCLEDSKNTQKQQCKRRLSAAEIMQVLVVLRASRAAIGLGTGGSATYMWRAVQG